AANLMAMLVQYLSAKVGIATGRNLPELCRETLPRSGSAAPWVQAEVVAIATDLAEFVGAAVATNLLFNVPPFTAGLMTAVEAIEGAHSGLGTIVGGGAALAFAVALLASGLSSSSVGTFAGQVVMQGLIDRRIPLFLRRALTMAPALIVLAIGVDPTSTLVIS